VQWKTCWIAEVYLPTHVENLTAALGRYEWDVGIGRRPDVLGWLRATREHGTAHGAWMNVSWLSARPSSNRLPKLPSCASSARVALHAVASSITVATVDFGLNDESQDAVEDILRSDAQTEVIPTGGGTHVVRSVDLVKVHRILESRAAMHRSLAKWMGENLPGAFAAADPDSYPRCDLFLTEQLRPFLPREEATPAWASLMEFDLAFDAWETPEFPGLRMRYPGFREPPSLLTLAGRRRDLLREDHPPRQLHEDEFLGIVGREFGGFLARWGLSELVSERTSRLAELRDIARRQPRRRAGAAVRQNQKVQAELLPLSGDVQALASDGSAY
jgi:hypothetical protein